MDDGPQITPISTNWALAMSAVNLTRSSGLSATLESSLGGRGLRR
jgi:hypothetical protein